MRFCMFGDIFDIARIEALVSACILLWMGSLLILGKLTRSIKRIVRFIQDDTQPNLT